MYVRFGYFRKRIIMEQTLRLHGHIKCTLEKTRTTYVVTYSIHCGRCKNAVTIPNHHDEYYDVFIAKKRYIYYHTN